MQSFISFSPLRALVGSLALITLAACQDSTEISAVTTPSASRAELVTLAVDPSPMGPYDVLEDVDYNFGRITVTDPIGDRSYESDVHGYVRYSKTASTPMPMVLLMHGRHQTCETEIGQLPVLIADDDQCPNTPLVHPALSYRGYDYLAENLASHGYFVISIDANDINDSDGSATSGDAGANARAQLIKSHLDSFRDIHNGNPVSGDVDLTNLVGALDIDHIGVMGHSRGGDGVSRYVAYNREQTEPHHIVATFALAPTDYNQEFVDGATFATLLPYCDGDVEDVQGAFIYDDSRFLDADDPSPKFQIVTMGSNHNYFNTVWTSDDWTITDFSGSDSFCGTNTDSHQRDTPEEQRALGLFFMASFFRYYVGGETEYGHYWNGQAQVPDFACPAGAGPCEDRHHLSVHAPAQDRMLISDFGGSEDLALNDVGGAIYLDGFSAFEICDPDRDGVGCPSATTFSITPQLALQWTSAATLSNQLPNINASDFDVLSIRAAVSTLNADKDIAMDFSLSLFDTAGQSATVMASSFSDSLYHPPGDPEGGGSRKTLLNAIDIPLTAFEGVDLNSLKQLQIGFPEMDDAYIQLADLMLMRTAP